MKKRFLALLLGFSMLSTISVNAINNGNQAYSYSQPSKLVTVAETFKASDIDLPFTDISQNDSFYQSISHLYSQGFMNGITQTTFDPNMGASRATFLTVLYRMSGGVPVNYIMPFSDVDQSSWYGEAVRWGASNKITSGIDASAFAPDDILTREQLITMLWRYSKFMGTDVSVGENTNILSYEDVFDVSDYAFPAIQWACGSGVVKGKTESTLNPLSYVTRGELATIMFNYLNK